MSRIELKKCYRDYRWRCCRISNQEVRLFENKKQAYDYLDKGYGCNVQELDSSVVIDSYFGVYEPSKWVKIEEENEHFGVMTLRTDWRLGGIMKGIVAYRRDYTYLDLMSDKDKAELLEVLNGDEWHDIRFIAVDKDGDKYHADVRFTAYERDEVGLDEWIRENLWVRHTFSNYSSDMAASDFTFNISEFKSAYWFFA